MHCTVEVVDAGRSLTLRKPKYARQHNIFAFLVHRAYSFIRITGVTG